jgi:hypothetical protein
VVSVELGELVSLAGSGGSAARARPRACDTYEAPPEAGAPESANQAMPAAENLEEGERYYIACFYTDGPTPELAYADYFVYEPGIEAQLAEAIARSLANELPLPHPMPATAPAIDAPHLVGLPTWLWTETPWEPVTLSVELTGFTITVAATPTTVDWHLGENDDATITCTGPGTPWTPGTSNDSDCTYTYQWVPQPPATTYPASATLTWDVTYTATGQPGGSLGTNSTTTTFDLAVTERQAVVCYDTALDGCNPT